MRLSLRIRKSLFPLDRLIRRCLLPGPEQGGPPRGVFSEEEGIRSGTVPGHLQTPWQGMPRIPDDSEIRLAGLGQHLYTGWQPLWSAREKALLAGPSMAHINHLGEVCNEAIYGAVHGWADPVWKRKPPATTRHLEGNHTSIISRWNQGGNYYHWFLDGLTRLVHLQNFPADCRVLVPANLPHYARRSLELLEIDDRATEVCGEDLLIGHYWFAGPTMVSGCPDPVGVRWLRQQFLPDPPPAPHRHLYVERESSTRKLVNAVPIRKLMERAGWQVIDPGSLSLDEQIQLFSEAAAVAGCHGAALTNLLWCQPGTQVLEFMPIRRRNGCYAGISLVAGLHHHTLLCQSNRLGDLSVSEESLVEALEDLPHPPPRA